MTITAATQKLFAPLRALPNLSAQATIGCDFKSVGTPPDGVGKDRFVEWCMRPSTRHLFLSGYEGVQAGMRVSRENPPVKMLALIADFDCQFDASLDVRMARIKETLPEELWPVAFTKTHSNGVRVLWVFEAPMMFYGQAVHKRFLTHLGELLKLKRLFPNLDKNYLDNIHYFEVGTDWVEVTTRPLLAKWTMTALVNAIGELNRVAARARAKLIPLEQVAKLIETQFPGRWPGAFELNARGPRFWDSGASNPTAAVVKEDGMICFTGERPFLSWRDIFGPDAVESYEAERIHKAVENVYFDGNSYWYRDARRVWYDWKQAALVTHLKVTKGLGSVAEDEGGQSEVEQALDFVNQFQRIEAAVPLVHQREGLIDFDGRAVLNIGAPSPMAPAPGPGEFPALGEFLENFFGDSHQLDIFLAWLRRFYVSGLECRPTKGQTLFIAGDTHAGKTLLSTFILSRIMGGSIDATEFLMGKDAYSAPYLSKPLWTVDDSESASGQAHASFSARLKRMAANTRFMFTQKYMRGGVTEWSGRVVVTCNLDPESIRVLPNVEASILDKLIFLRAADRKRSLPEGLAQTVAKELPYFLHWLLEWTPPPDVLGNSRYGVKSFHDAGILAEATNSSPAAGFLEWLVLFLEEYFRDKKDSHEWVGTSAQLVAEMGLSELMKNALKDLSSNQIGKRLGQLMLQGFPVQYRRTRQGNVWAVDRSILDKEAA